MFELNYCLQQGDLILWFIENGGSFTHQQKTWTRNSKLVYIKTMELNCLISDAYDVFIYLNVYLFYLMLGIILSLHLLYFGRESIVHQFFLKILFDKHTNINTCTQYKWIIFITLWVLICLVLILLNSNWNLVM